MEILIISNYRSSIGGISGQIDFYLHKLKENRLNFSLFNTKKNNFKRLFLPFKLLHISGKYDVFHIHGCSYLGFYPIIIGVIVGKLTGKRCIVTYHGGGLKEFLTAYPRIVRYFLRSADLLTVPSPYLEKILIENDIDVKLLPNIIREDNVLFKKRNHIEPKFVVTRSLEEVYNIELVIRSFKSLKKEFKQAELYIVGDGSLRSNLEKLVTEMKLDGVFFIGRVENSTIGSVLNEADIYLNPTNKDNMPLSLFEAFACGLPVISTNVGGLPDFIKDGYNGFLIQPNNEEELLEKMRFVLKNESIMQPIIRNGFDTFKRYTWTSLKLEYLSIYEPKL